MRVLDHEPGEWFLLSDAEGLLLDVLVDNGFVSWSTSLRLDPVETGDVRERGRTAVADLAAAIRTDAAATDWRNHPETSRFGHRDLNRSAHPHAAAVHETIVAWRADHDD